MVIIDPLIWNWNDTRSRWGGRTLTNKELCRANEILKLASAFFAQTELARRLKS